MITRLQEAIGTRPDGIGFTTADTALPKAQEEYRPGGMDHVGDRGRLLGLNMVSVKTRAFVLVGVTAAFAGMRPRSAARISGRSPAMGFC
jgi:hypothetical protein